MIKVTQGFVCGNRQVGFVVTTRKTWTRSITATATVGYYAVHTDLEHEAGLSSDLCIFKYSAHIPFCYFLLSLPSVESRCSTPEVDTDEPKCKAHKQTPLFHLLSQDGVTGYAVISGPARASRAQRGLLEACGGS